MINSRPDPPDLSKGAASSAPKAAGSHKGVAKGAPASQRVRQNYHPNEPDLSIFRRNGFNWGNHAVTEIPGAFDDELITVGIDWYKTCILHYSWKAHFGPQRLCSSSSCEISEDNPVQFVIVSFSGWSGSDRAQWEIERFVAYCYTDLQLPFVGLQSSDHKIPYRFAG